MADFSGRLPIDAQIAGSVIASHSAFAHSALSRANDLRCRDLELALCLASPISAYRGTADRNGAVRLRVEEHCADDRPDHIGRNCQCL